MTVHKERLCVTMLSGSMWNVPADDWEIHQNGALTVYRAGARVFQAAPGQWKTAHYSNWGDIYIKPTEEQKKMLNIDEAVEEENGN